MFRVGVGVRVVSAKTAVNCLDLFIEIGECLPLLTKCKDD
jgi:hypothetical protein